MALIAKKIPSKQRYFFRGDPFTSIVLLVGVFLLSQFVAVLIASLYPAIRNWTELESINWLNSVGGRFAFILIAEVLAVLGVWRLAKAANVHIGKLGVVMPRLRDAGWAILAYGLYFMVYIAVAFVISNLIPAVDLQQEQEIGFEGARYAGELSMTFLSLVVIVPLAEEIMFRGFLFSSLRAKYRFWPATIVTGLIFGAAHLQLGSSAPLLWVAAIDTFILSCFLCYLREEFKSIWPPVYLHALKNGVAFVILFAL